MLLLKSCFDSQTNLLESVLLGDGPGDGLGDRVGDGLGDGLGEGLFVIVTEVSLTAHMLCVLLVGISVIHISYTPL